ncbi:hypothetical protein Vadar_016220 [Vaccinium darrowii]|uniref:Uncharacterized protein n=1 Tax=Vaccinium darrowii TaxID=229202 RepID=A0ACB7Y8M9_9ERIC|nr:hypothetical protein Vadar_016220 [Vaccinium darrowii]
MLSCWVVGLLHLDGPVQMERAWAVGPTLRPTTYTLTISLVANLKKHVDACGLSKKIELVIVSPLLRTMQTAVGVFRGEGYMNGINVPPLMAWEE